MQEPIWEIVTPADLTFNPFTLIGKEWMLVLPATKPLTTP